MPKDILGQEIQDGDFIVAASKSEGEMVMGVIKEVQKQTRVRIEKHHSLGWVSLHKATRMHTFDRTLKLSDEFVASKDPDLFQTMNEVRVKNNLPIVSKQQVTQGINKDLQRILEGIL